MDGEDSDYKLWIGGYSGNASDSLSVHNGYKFSTIDRYIKLEGFYKVNIIKNLLETPAFIATPAVYPRLVVNYDCSYFSLFQWTHSI